VFIDNLDELLLPDLAGQIERMSIFDATSTRAAPEPVGSDSNRSEDTIQTESLSDLEEDLDRLLKLEDAGATTRRGPLIFDNYSDSTKSTH
jgi:predicted oxidoreductase